MKALILFLILLISGCTTLKDIRSFAPEYSTTSPTEPKIISNCIAYECQNKFSGYHISAVEIDGIYNITISTVGPMGVVPYYEVTVKPDSKKWSKIELRSNPDVLFLSKTVILEIIHGCSSSTKTPPSK